MNKKLNWKISQKIIIKSEKNIKNEEIVVDSETLMNLMENFLMEADIQDNSKKTYFKGLKNFILWCLKINNDNEETKIPLSKKLLISYKNNLTSSASTIKPHTQALYLVSLKQFFIWSESNLLFPNIAKDIKGIKKITKQHHKDPLKKEDIEKLLNYEKKETNHKKILINCRNKTLIHLLIFTGMRIGEAANIQIKDIEYVNEEKILIWIKGKGRTGKDTFIVLLKESIEILEEYIKIRKHYEQKINEDSYLFSSHGNLKNINKKINTDTISRIVRKKMEEVQIKTKRISAHSLRHTYGVLAIQSGISLHELQISMRHSTPSTTQVYLGDIEKEKRKEANTERTIINFFKNKKKI